MYTFNGFCKTVIRFAALNAWRDRSRRRQKEISLEYLTEEKFYPLGTTDKYFEAPYEEYPITICGTPSFTMRRICAVVVCAVRPLRPAPTGLFTARTAGSVSPADRPPSA